MLLPLFSSSCCDKDKNFVCVYNNKDVTVFNDTAFDIDVIIKDNFSAIQVGTVNSFDIEVFNVPYGVIIEAGTVDFSSELVVDPCVRKLELVVDN